MPLDQLTKASHQRIATLQADGFEEDSGQRWTALAIGPCDASKGSRSAGRSRPSLSLPGSDERGELFRLQPAVLSGHGWTLCKEFCARDFVRSVTRTARRLGPGSDGDFRLWAFTPQGARSQKGPWQERGA